MIVKGQKLSDRYEILKMLGEGGMANVYLAYDTILERKVAIKVLRGDLSTDEKFVRRFQREALAASSLSHPNIVEMYDVGEDDGSFYIVMDYVEGKNLKQLIKKQTSTNFLIQLETRLDILLWRIGLFNSPAIARFFLIHKNIKLNNQEINLSSIKVKKGDVITLSSTAKNFVKSNFNKIKTLQPKTVNKKFVLFNSHINQFIPYYVLINWNTLELICINNINENNMNALAHMYPKNLNSTLVKTYLRLQ